MPLGRGAVAGRERDAGLSHPGGGTRRLLGVTTAGFDAEAADVVPANVAHYLRANRADRLWGRFLVCPLAPERAGLMRPVRLLAARRLSPAH